MNENTTWTSFRFSMAMRLIGLGIDLIPKGTAKENMNNKFMEWLFDCVKAYEVRNAVKTGKITCRTCGCKFDPIDGMMQANGCAADVMPNGTIIGYYGSNIIDMEVWNITTRPPELKSGMICDACIEDLTLKGMISKKSNEIVF